MTNNNQNKGHTPQLKLSIKCQFIKQDGNKCQADVMKDSNYCYLHNPDISDEEKRQNQARGGKGNLIKINNPLPPVIINNPHDVVNFLTETINLVRSGELDIRIANALAYLAGHLIKALEISEVDKRVSTIERIILERSTK